MKRRRCVANALLNTCILTLIEPTLSSNNQRAAPAAASVAASEWRDAAPVWPYAANIQTLITEAGILRRGEGGGEDDEH